MVDCVVATAGVAVLARPAASSPRLGHVHVASQEEWEEALATGLTGNWNDSRIRLEERGITPYAVNDEWTLQPDVEYIIRRDSSWNEALALGLGTNLVF